MATQEVSAIDPFWLAGRYVEPNVQETNPADQKEESPYPAARVNQFHTWLSLFLQKPVSAKDGRHVLFLLADAGMGKTSSLIMIYLTNLTSFWPQSMRFELFKLGENTLARVKEIGDPENVVLLLDALDEDQTVFENPEARIRKILRATRMFRQVILTCRTQFFPYPRVVSDAEKKYEKAGKLEIGGFVCHLLYLSPFDDRKVYDYLEQIYTPGGEKFERARAIVESMDNLRIRPLLLSYIEDLMEAKSFRGEDILNIYNELVTRWLLRETRKLGRLGIEIERTDLQEICQDLAFSMLVAGDDSLSENQIQERLSPKAMNIIRPIDVGGRSLLNRKSDGSFRFAHQTIEEYLAFIKAATSKVALEALPDSDMINLFAILTMKRDKLNPLNLVILRKNLSGAELPRAELPGVRFYEGNISGANFTDANLSGARLFHARCMSTNFSNANLCGANFGRARLPDAICVNAKLCDADLSSADLSRGKFLRADLTNAKLKYAKLVAADLSSANLNGASLVKANFADANLAEADLQGADMKLANIRGVDLSRALNLTQVQLNFTIGDATTKIPQHLRRPTRWSRKDADSEGPIIGMKQ